MHCATSSQLSGDAYLVSLLLLYFWVVLAFWPGKITFKYICCIPCVIFFKSQLFWLVSPVVLLVCILNRQAQESIANMYWSQQQPHNLVWPQYVLVSTSCGVGVSPGNCTVLSNTGVHMSTGTALVAQKCDQSCWCKWMISKFINEQITNAAWNPQVRNLLN